MKAYLLCFISTLLFAYLSEKCFKQEKKRKGIFFLLIALFIPCFIAGARALTVGRDVQSYFLVLFNGFIRGESFFTVTARANVEFGYSLLIYISSIFKNISVSLFITQLFICFPIYLLAYKKRQTYSITFIIFIFLITLYSLSFNLLRQAIAISFIIYGISLYEEKNKKWIIYFLLAVSFHYSAIICLLMVLSMNIIKNCKKDRMFYLFLILAFVTAITIFFKPLLILIPNKYSVYIGSKYDISNFSIISVIKKLFWILLCLLYLNRYKMKQDENYSSALSYTTFFLIDFILYFMSLQLSSAGRLGYYFLYPGYFLFIPKFKEIFKEKYIINIIIIISLIFFWYNMTVVNSEVNATYPYTSTSIEFLNDH